MGQNGWVISPAIFANRVGGPFGTHARRQGRWFDPTTWALVAATITWLIVTVRQVPCRPLGEHFPDAFMRLCYSDIPTLYLGRGISTGAGLYTEVPLEYPVLIGYFLDFARTFTLVLGGKVSPDATYPQQIVASQIFFQITAVGLFICFLVTVLAHLRITADGRKPRGPIRNWDALLIAASPVVMATGLINWDMLAVMLTSLGLLVWSRRYPFFAGGVLGLAFAAKFYPILVLIAITMLCVRADKYVPMVKMWLGAAVTWLVVNVPIMATAWDGWLVFWTKNADRGADLGSIWYVLSLVQLNVPAVSAVAFALMAICGIGVVILVLRAPRRPRVAQIAVLLLIIFLVFNKVYSPQYVLWLLPLVVLARPVAKDIAVWTLAELVYYVSIWGFLQGVLGPGSGSDWVYWVSVLLRVSAQIWFALRVIDDILQPWTDPVRRPMVDDPLGGVINHQADAAWLLAFASGPRDWYRAERGSDAGALPGTPQTVASGGVADSTQLEPVAAEPGGSTPAEPPPAPSAASTVERPTAQ